MVYELILPLAGAFIIILLILLRRSGQAGEKQNARRRPTRSGLVLERSPKEKKAGRSSLTGPALIVLALIIIGGWLAVSYFNPGGPSASDGSGLEAAAGSAPEAAEDSRVMSGRLVMGEDSSPAAQGAPMAEAAARAGSAGAEAARNTARPQGDPDPAPPLPPNSGEASPAPAAPLAQAAQAMLPAVSRMEQVGLLPSRGGGNADSSRPRAQKPPTAAPRTDAPAARAEETGGGQAAASAAPPSNSSARAEGREILGGAREFTVHLGSFADRGNAEKYLGKLVTARVREAFITESTVNGRLWYRVMSGRFASQAEAEAHGGELKRRGLTAAGGRYVIKSIP